MTFPIISPIIPPSTSTKPLTSATGITGNWLASSPAILKRPFPDFKIQPLPSKDTSISSLPAHSLNILLTRTAGKTKVETGFKPVSTASPASPFSRGLDFSLAESVYLTNTSRSVAVNVQTGLKPVSTTSNLIPCNTCLIVEDGTILVTKLKPLYNSFPLKLRFILYSSFYLCGLQGGMDYSPLGRRRHNSPLGRG